MSFTLLHPDGTELATYPARTKVPLTASRNVYVPPLSLARVDHGIVLKTNPLEDLLIMTIRDSGLGLDRSLIVDQGGVDDGLLVTIVFNVSDQRALISKGEIICWLMEI